MAGEEFQRKKTEPFFPLEPNGFKNKNKKVIPTYHTNHTYLPSQLSIVDTPASVVSIKVNPTIYRAFATVCRVSGERIRDVLERNMLKYIQEKAGENPMITVQGSLETNITVNIQQQISVGTLIIAEEIKITINSLKQALERKAPQAFIRELRDQLLHACKQAKAVDPQTAEEIKQVLEEARVYLKTV